MPGEELVEAGDRMIGDPTQDVGEPGLWVDAVELSGLDQGEHRSGALAAAVGASEQPGLAADCDPAQRPLSGIVGQADASVVENAGEGGPALQHVIHGLGGFGMTCQPSALGTHPWFKIANDWLYAPLPHSDPPLDRG